MTKTKIICTIGPASESPEIIRMMILEGMDIARLNFSHGDVATHIRRYEDIRRISNELGREVAILQDLPGAKVRIGRFKQGRVRLKRGQQFVLSTVPCEGDENRVFIDYPELWRYVDVGHRIMLDDGNIELVADKVAEGEILCTVNRGGELSDRKGAVFPDSYVPFPNLTEDDRRALEVGARMGVDMVAVSFARNPECIEETREILRRHGASHVAVIAKIEEREGLRNLSSIAEESDGIMIARGDLGVCLPKEEVPLLQERIIKLCRRKEKPVIVATQMLESMVNQPVPTRAEVTDVAQAALLGADALMLSAETAVGKFPVEAVREMAAILKTVEESPEFLVRVIREKAMEVSGEKLDFYRAVARAIDELSQAVGISAILCTDDDSLVKMLSAHRPAVPIYFSTSNEMKARSMLLWWGVEPLVGDWNSSLRRLSASQPEGNKILLIEGISIKPTRVKIEVVEIGSCNLS